MCCRCVLFVDGCCVSDLVSVVCCLLCGVVGCVLSVVVCSLSAVRCSLLFVVCCSLFAVRLCDDVCCLCLVIVVS